MAAVSRAPDALDRIKRVAAPALRFFAASFTASITSG